MEQLTERITDLIYKSYGSESGILFGIKERKITEEIIKFTLRYVERHKNDETEMERKAKQMRSYFKANDL